ncbi:MAG TPA: tyrosine-type recombinase/integrase, partial [Gemmatimonadaceae bacterium]|nr:tyrosine-type recombinase/integrase [Gemmatimonadaceae bacterium]
KDDKPHKVPLNAHSDAVLARRHAVAHGDFVFRSQNWDTYRSAWENALSRAKLADVTFHTLRHTFGSWLAQAGRTPKEIMEALGHTSLAMTNRYMHLAPSHVRDAVAVLDNVLGVHTAARDLDSRTIAERALSARGAKRGAV